MSREVLVDIRVGVDTLLTEVWQLFGAVSPHTAFKYFIQTPQIRQYDSILLGWV
jgi:hypothetical protein